MDAPFRGEVDSCEAPGCDRERTKSSRIYCSLHYQRARNGVPFDKVERIRRPVGAWGAWYDDGYGYRIRSRVTDEGVREVQRQHRVVMEGILGRRLLPGEEVHHKNGVRSDNRPENLELWVVSQPKGQRPEDLVAWARVILERYGD